VAVEVLDALALVGDLEPDADDRACARLVDLALSDEGEPGVRRVRRGRGFSFHSPDGTLLDGDARRRCLELAVPPAWTDVWICARPDGHLQATGRDDAGRKQYLYHPTWRALREAVKFASLPTFGAVLPMLREQVDADLRRRRLDRRRVLAMVVALLDETLVRIGNEGHADEEGGHGLTTLTLDHVEVGSTVTRFCFPGKSGVEQQHTVRCRRLTRQLRCMLDAGQPQVFAWTEDGTAWRDVRAEDVNAHLRAVTGEAVSAKDFRTWGGTVTALAQLRAAPPAEGERELDQQRLAAVDAVAEALGNTRAVARSSYVDPRVLAAHGTSSIAEAYEAAAVGEPGLRVDERALLALLGA
jgi:DNA topoisomerase I